MSGKELFLTGNELRMSGFEPSDSSPEGPVSEVNLGR